MICPFCQNIVNDMSGTLMVMSVHCKNHKPHCVRLTQDIGRNLQQAMVYFAWDRESNLVVTWIYPTNQLAVQFMRIIQGFEEFEDIAILNKIPSNLTLDNAKEFAQRYLKLRAFS